MFSDISYFNLDEQSIDEIYPALMLDEARKHNHASNRNFSKRIEVEHSRLVSSREPVSLRQFISLTELAIEADSSGDLGFRFGCRLDVICSGSLGMAMMSSATLGDALALAMKYYPIAGIAMDLRFLRRERDLHVIAPNLTQLSPVVRRFLFEAWFSAWQAHIRFLTRKRLYFSEVHFAYNKPGNSEIYHSMFGCPVFFDNAYNKIVLPLTFLHEPLPTADATVFHFSVEKFQSQLDGILRNRAISARIADKLLNWQSKYPSVEEMAQMLRMSPRSLSSRLRRDGTSYQKVLNHVRTKVAIDLILRNMSISEVAERLGFSDCSNFRKAFRKWSGRTPTSFKESRSESAVSRAT
jgi:AraC-like DNA-binding protein